MFQLVLSLMIVLFPLELLANCPKIVVSNPPTWQVPLIVIDPGHGGKDPGTHCYTFPKYEEKILALKTAQLVSQNLRELGYRTVLTRNDDTFIELYQRAAFANERRAIAFVSIHYNSAANENVHGIEIFYYQTDPSKRKAQASRKMGENVIKELVNLTQAKNRGVKHANFVVVRETKMPAILIECGFLTNAQERSKLFDPNYQESLAMGIAKGLDATIRKK